MGDRDHRAAARQLVERLLHGALGLGVEGARRLVEDQDRRVSQDRARDRDPLLLAARESVAPLADHRLVALGETLDQVVDLGGPRRVLDLGVGGVGLREAEVVRDRGVEQVGLL